MSLTRAVGHRLAGWLRAEPVVAHCDIPCGIYDPHTACQAAQTVQKMVGKLLELELPLRQGHASTAEQWTTRNALTRMINVKEAHAQLCKQELLILWTDYFKEEHLRQFPDLHEAFWKAVKLCSGNKQHVDAEQAQQLVDACRAIAEMFHAAEEAKVAAPVKAHNHK